MTPSLKEKTFPRACQVTELLVEVLGVALHVSVLA